MGSSRGSSCVLVVGLSMILKGLSMTWAMGVLVAGFEDMVGRSVGVLRASSGRALMRVMESLSFIAGSMAAPKRTCAFSGTNF